MEMDMPRIVAVATALSLLALPAFAQGQGAPPAAPPAAQPAPAPMAQPQTLPITLSAEKYQALFNYLNEGGEAAHRLSPAQANPILLFLEREQGAAQEAKRLADAAIKPPPSVGHPAAAPQVAPAPTTPPSPSVDTPSAPKP